MVPQLNDASPLSLVIIHQIIPSARHRSAVQYLYVYALLLGKVIVSLNSNAFQGGSPGPIRCISIENHMGYLTNLFSLLLKAFLVIGSDFKSRLHFVFLSTSCSCHRVLPLLEDGRPDGVVARIKVATASNVDRIELVFSIV